MKKKSGKIILYSLLGIAIITGLVFGIMYLTNLSIPDFLSYHLYDENGNPLSTASLSTVQGVLGVSFIDLTITAVNTGTEPLTCSIVSATPNAFGSALDGASKYIPSTSPKMASWTTSLIEVSQFEALTQPVRFEATIRCAYTRGVETIYLPDKSGYIDLNIQADEANAGFDVSVGTGGLESEFCGDNICQPANGEDIDSCPYDCGVANYVSFRTSDLSYVSGSALAYTDTCGNELNAFGFDSKVGGGPSDCFSGSVSINYELIGEVPGSIIKYPGDADSNVTLHKSMSNPEEVIVCQKRDPNYLGGGVEIVVYKSSSPNAGNVETTSVSFDTDKEVAC